MFKQICSGQHIQGRFNTGSERTNLILNSTEDPVVQVSVISDYEKCNQMVADLKLAAGKYQSSKQHNQTNPERVKVTKTVGCCQKRHFDAEKYYREQIKELQKKIV